MTIEMRTYLHKDGDFVPYEDFGDTIANPMHIHGAIELVVNGTALLGADLHDDVDQLWSYVIDATSDAVDRGRGTLLFPDTPISVSFERLKLDELAISVDWPRPNGRRAHVNLTEFLHELRSHLTAFFERMWLLVPENRASYEDSLARLARLTAHPDRQSREEG